MNPTTDALNLAEIHAHYTRLARAIYADRLRLGYPTGAARCEALAYLRRKTHWPEPVAAGAFDSIPDQGVASPTA